MNGAALQQDRPLQRRPPSHSPTAIRSGKATESMRRPAGPKYAIRIGSIGGGYLSPHRRRRRSRPGNGETQYRSGLSRKARGIGPKSRHSRAGEDSLAACRGSFAGTRAMDARPQARRWVWGRSCPRIHTHPCPRRGAARFLGLPPSPGSIRPCRARSGPRSRPCAFDRTRC